MICYIWSEFGGNVSSSFLSSAVNRQTFWKHNFFDSEDPKTDISTKIPNFNLFTMYILSLHYCICGKVNKDYKYTKRLSATSTLLGDRFLWFQIKYFIPNKINANVCKNSESENSPQILSVCSRGSVHTDKQKRANFLNLNSKLTLK